MQVPSIATLNDLFNSPALETNAWSVTGVTTSNFNRWSNALPKTERMNIFFEYIACGIILPDKFSKEYFTSSIISELIQIYMNPHALIITVNGCQKEISLTFAQFKVVYLFLQTTPEGREMPLINCPPEYWYLLCTVRAPKYSITYIPKGNLVRDMFEGKTAEVACEDLTQFFPSFLGSTGSARYDSHVTVALPGPKNLPGFELTPAPFKITKSLYVAFPQYWDYFSEIESVCDLSLNIRSAVQLHNVLPVQHTGTEITPEYVFTSFEKKVEEDVSGECSSLVLPVVPLVPRVLYLEDQPVLEVNTVQVNCSICHPKIERLEEAFVNNIGPVDLEDALDSISLSSPMEIESLLHLSPEAQAFSIGFGSTALQDTSHDLNGSPSTLFVPGDGELAVDQQTLKTFLDLEAIASPLLSPKFFQRDDTFALSLPYDAHATRWSAHSTSRMPHQSFMKHAQLLLEMGLVKIGPDLNFPVGKFPGPLSLRVFYPAGTSLGPVAAMIESGVAAFIAMPKPKYQPIKDPPYLKEPIPSFHFVLGDDKSPRSLTTIARSLQRNIPSPSLTPKEPDRPFKRYDLIIFDDKTPLNFSAPVPGRLLGEITKITELQELVHKLPFKRVQAYEKRLADVDLILSVMLEPGGYLVLRLNEVVHQSTIALLSRITSKFKTSRLVRSPHSSPLSKEFYYLGAGYDPDTSSLSFLSDSYKLLASITKFNTQLYWLASRNLKLSFKRFARLHHKPRIRACRCFLRSLRGVYLPQGSAEEWPQVPFPLVRQMPYYQSQELVALTSSKNLSSPMTYNPREQIERRQIDLPFHNWLRSKFNSPIVWALFKSIYRSYHASADYNKPAALNEAIRMVTLEPFVIEILLKMNPYQLDDFDKWMTRSTLT